MKIDQPQYEKAYRVGLQVHDGEFGITEGTKRVVAAGMNPASAADLIYGVSHMLKGTRYIRSISLVATDHFLTWIRRDRGEHALATALASLRQHINYNVTELNERSPGLKSLLSKHQALLNQPMKTFLLLEWRGGESVGFTDELPLAWFAQDGEFHGERHPVYDGEGNQYAAYCDVSVHGLVAELNYERHAERNLDEDMSLGVARLTFQVHDRAAISKVEWKPHGSDDFRNAGFKVVDYPLPPVSDYNPPKNAAKKSMRMVRQRPGQVAFRRNLREVYGDQCCMSECPIQEALQGAHIDPYRAPASDHIRNGLLLRSDLHALFDAHLIAIDPDTMQIHVAERIRGMFGYEHLHGKLVREPNNPAYRADKDALRRQWEKRHR